MVLLGVAATVWRWCWMLDFILFEVRVRESPQFISTCGISIVAEEALSLELL